MKILPDFRSIFCPNMVNVCKFFQRFRGCSPQAPVSYAYGLDGSHLGFGEMIASAVHRGIFREMGSCRNNMQ